MPTTPIYALPYPATTDPADVPLDLQKLAERLEAVLPPLFSERLADEPTTSAAYVDLATSGPEITVPVAGTYIASFGARAYSSDVGTHLTVAIKRGAAATSDNDRCDSYVETAFVETVIARELLLSGLTVGTLIKLQYKTSKATGSFSNRWLRLTRLN